MEMWLNNIQRAQGTRAKIRNLMSALFQRAMRYGWSDTNPIELVRQSAKRERPPEVWSAKNSNCFSASLPFEKGRWCCLTRRRDFA